MEVKIAVIGQSESGKSSFINNLLGDNVAVHDDSEALTVKQYAAPKKNEIVFNSVAIFASHSFASNFNFPSWKLTN